MDYQRRKELVEDSADVITLEGVECSVAGYNNPYATLSPAFGGFWHASWETVGRVLAGDRNFTADDVQFASWRWLGTGIEVPPRLRHYLDVNV